MLWICNPCTAAYSPDAPRCPQCGSTDYREQGEPMPKITVHGGPTNAAAGPTITGGAWGDPPAEAPVELSPAEDGLAPSTVTVAAGEVDMGPGVAGIAETAEPSDPVFDYDSCTVAQLREFLSTRPGDLSTDGRKQDLIDRLRADDTATAVSGG